MRLLLEWYCGAIEDSREVKVIGEISEQKENVLIFQSISRSIVKGPMAQAL